MGNAYGIDLGTTYSVIAKLGATGAPETIDNAESGKDILASAVYFNKNGEVTVGDNAKEEGAVNPDRLKQFFKRWIGLNNHPDREHYLVDGQEYDPIQLSAMVLGRIVQYAKDSGEDVHDVVITCPAYFDYAQRDATKQAGIAAGLNVMAIINEPTAAAINYCANRFSEDQTVLVYDLGGGTFDVTLMRMIENSGNREVEVLGTDGDAFLGGYEWDKALFNILLSKYEEQYGISPDRIADDLRAELRGSVEGIKIKLTTKEKAKTKIPYEGENIVLEVTREEFETATANYVEQTVGWLDSVLNKANCSDADIDVVLLVGGSTKMPMIRNMLETRFGAKAFFGEPDKAVAKGAAIIADQKQKGETSRFLEQLQEQVARGQISVVVKDGKVNVVQPDTDKIIPELQDEFKRQLDNLGGNTSINLEEHIDGGDKVNISEFVSTAKDQIEQSGGDVTIRDVAPRTFGLVVRRPSVNGGLELVVDNIVRKDEQTPCTYERTYYTPAENVTRLRFPVIESVSEDDADVIGLNEVTGEFILNDVLSMKQRNVLVLPVPAGLPAESEIKVVFSLDDLGNVYMKATEPVSGATQNVKFNFNEISQEKLDEFKRVQQNVLYAMDD